MATVKQHWKVEDVLVRMAIRTVNLKNMKQQAIQNEDYMTAKSILQEIN
jgi:hypothetical protein